MKIVKLSASNVMRLSAIEITPDGALVIVAGRNEQGKTSVLDSIAMCLGGAKLMPPKPVRNGQRSASVTVDMGDLQVTRTMSASGGGTLVVTNKDGARYPSPQALLDKLLGTLTFDPLAFERQPAKAQAETLRQLVGLDTSDLDTERQRLYDERTQVNRDLKTADVTAKSQTYYPEAPDAEISIAALSEELEAAERAQRVADKAAQAVIAAQTKRQRLAERATAAEAELERARLAFVAADEALAKAQAEVETHDGSLLALETASATALAGVPDTAAIRQRVREAEGVNARVRANGARRLAYEAWEGEKAASEALSGRILALDTARAERIAAVAFPVPGLGLDETGVTYEGLPFEQAATSVRLRVSVAIGLAMNPTLRVLLVRDGSLLDAANLKMIAEMAEAAQSQIWIERVSETPEGATIFIEAGAVKAFAPVKDALFDDPLELVE